jgi:hypothetical protein
MGDDANTCVETEGYTRFGTIDTDTQTFHIASWSPDEVIATDVERGLPGATSTTLVIYRPVALEIRDATFPPRVEAIGKSPKPNSREDFISCLVPHVQAEEKTRGDREERKPVEHATSRNCQL